MGSTVSVDFDITRVQLAQFVKDPRTIRDLEAFLRTVRKEVPAVVAVKVDETRTIGTDATLTGGGDLSADRTLGIDTTAEAERIRDVIGAALVPGANITITVDDAGDTITIASTGGYTNEQAQDAVGTILTDTSTIDFTYDDTGNAITADVKTGSIGPAQLADTAVTPGTYGDSTHVARFTVDQDGRVTSVSTVAVAGGSGGGGGPVALGVTLAMANGTFSA